jgi:hypothetical protein
MLWMLLARYIGSWGWQQLRSTSYVSSKSSKSGADKSCKSIKSGKSSKKSKAAAKKSDVSNIGREDCLFRAIIGTIALFLLLMIKDGLIIRYLLCLTALIGLLTAYMRFSPIYALIGENTRNRIDPEMGTSQ